MKNSVIFVFLTLLVVSYAAGKTITVDVTGDGVADEVIMGFKTVAVRDGASAKLHTVVSEVEFLVDITVGDYYRAIKGNEIAVIILPEEYVTEVYGYRNKMFVRVSEELPGDISFDKEGRLFGYLLRKWNGFAVNVPLPIVEEGGFLKPAVITQEIDTHVVVEKFTTDEISLIVSQYNLVVCVAAIPEKDAVVFFKNEEGTLIRQMSIEPRKPFVATAYIGNEETFTLSIDNLQSSETKTIYYIIKQYTYPPMKR